jgi:predicted PurR-regulated permease PerM
MTFDAILTWLGTLNLDLIRDFIEANAGTMAALASRVLDQGAAVIGVLSTLVITPIVAVYMLYDWDNLVARTDALLPRDHADTIRDLAKKIDHVMAGFIRGQFILALILGTFYATALTLVGLNFGLLIGLGAGLLSFIPYIGSLVGFGTSVGVALVQFWSEPWWIVAVAGIFVFGQFVEGNFLQPKIVGDAVGLHPVVLFFAMLAFGSLYGFLGLLIAVPVAASIGVLTRFGVSRYKKASSTRVRTARPGLHRPAPTRVSDVQCRSTRSGYRPAALVRGGRLCCGRGQRKGARPHRHPGLANASRRADWAGGVRQNASGACVCP